MLSTFYHCDIKVKVLYCDADKFIAWCSIDNANYRQLSCQPVTVYSNCRRRLYRPTVFMSISARHILDSSQQLAYPVHCIIWLAELLKMLTRLRYTGAVTRNALIARFMGPKCDQPGADRTQLGPMLAPRTLLSGRAWYTDPLSRDWKNCEGIYLSNDDLWSIINNL